MSCVLLLWTQWHDEVPACCFSEELNEAAISRLRKALKQHPQSQSFDEAMDLYMAVRPGTPGAKRIGAGGVVRDWVAQSTARLHSLPRASALGSSPSRAAVAGRGQAALSATPGAGQMAEGSAVPPPPGTEGASALVTYVERLESKDCVALLLWPSFWQPPRTPTNSPPRPNDLAKVLRRSLLLMLRDEESPAYAAAELDMWPPGTRRLLPPHCGRSTPPSWVLSTPRSPVPPGD